MLSTPLLLLYIYVYVYVIYINPQGPGLNKIAHFQQFGIVCERQ